MAFHLLFSDWKFNLGICLAVFFVGLAVSCYYFAKIVSKDLAGGAENRSVCVNVDDQTQMVAESYELEQTRMDVDGGGDDDNDDRILREILVETQILTRRGNDEYSSGNHYQAIYYYAQALSICPESETELMSILYQNRAITHKKLNNRDHCLEDCNNALLHLPTNNLVLSLKAKVFSELALEKLEENKKKKYLPSKTFIMSYLKSFCEKLYNDEFSQSLIDSEVNSGLELTLKYLKNNEFEKIEDACEDELMKTDNCLIRKTLTLNILATFCILRGNYALGLSYLNSIIEEPKVSDKLIINSLIKRASVYYTLNELDKCFEDFYKAEQINPMHPDVFHHRAQIYLLEINSEKAIDDLRQAVNLNPTFVLSKIQLYFAQYLHAKKLSDKLSATGFLKKLETFPNNHPEHAESFLLYGQALLEEEAYKEADYLFAWAYSNHPENASFLVDRAKSKLSQNYEIDEAHKLLEQALSVDSKCFYAYETLGSLLTQLEISAQAVECFENAMQWTRSKKEILRILLLKDLAQLRRSF